MEHIHSMQSREQKRAEKAKKGSDKKRSHCAMDDSDCTAPARVLTKTSSRKTTKSASLSARKKSSSSASSTAATMTKTNNSRKQHIIQPTNSTRNATNSDPRALSGIRHPGKHDCLNGRGGAYY